MEGSDERSGTGEDESGPETWVNQDGRTEGCGHEEGGRFTVVPGRVRWTGGLEDTGPGRDLGRIR